MTRFQNHLDSTSLLREPVAYHAADYVRRAAGSLCDDDPDRLRGISLGRHMRGAKRGEGCDAQEPHESCSPVCFSPEDVE